MSQPLKVTYMLMAQDPERAQRFYRDGLGATIVWSDPDGSWTVMEVGGREVCLHGNGTGALADTGFAVEVEDLEQACAAIERSGGHILRPSSKDWLAIATDTEGNRFCVVRHGGCFLHPSLFPEAASSNVS